MNLIQLIYKLIKPHWFKLFISWVIIGALVAHNQKLNF